MQAKTFFELVFLKQPNLKLSVYGPAQVLLSRLFEVKQAQVLFLFLMIMLSVYVYNIACMLQDTRVGTGVHL